MSTINLPDGGDAAEGIHALGEELRLFGIPSEWLFWLLVGLLVAWFLPRLVRAWRSGGHRGGPPSGG